MSSSIDRVGAADLRRIAAVSAALHKSAERDLDEAQCTLRWDLRGGGLRFDREEWGVILDALIQHRGHADDRKAANSESTSDERADMCADLIGRINAAAAQVQS